VIDVQMREKDVVDRHNRHLHGDDIAQTARAQVEEESVTVAQFDHHAGAGLVASRREGAASHEGDPHFVRAELLADREVVARVHHAWGWPEIGRQADPAARFSAVGVLGYRNTCVVRWFH